MRRLALLLTALILGAGIVPPSPAGQARERKARKEKKEKKGSGGFPRTFAEVAVPEDQLPKVIKGHPRLYLRAEKWKYGISVGELKARAKKEPWAGRFSKPPGNDYDAALYYLATGDESVVPRVVQGILRSKAAASKTGTPTIKLAVMYDWIASSRKIGDQDRRKMQEKIIEAARSACRKQERHGDFWHHRGAGRLGMAALIAGLALYGDHPEGETLLRQGVGYFRDSYLPGYAFTGGLWHGGGRSYYRINAVHIPKAIYMWASATEDDIFETIKKKYNNWFEGQMLYFMYNILPDGTKTYTTGFDQAVRHPYPWTENFMIFSNACGTSDGYAFVRWLRKRHKNFSEPRENVLLYREDIGEMKPRFPKGLPGAYIWGRDGAGYVQFRTGGWAPEATVIEFKCGDKIWSHTHNANQNAFTIYHKGHLALHTGLYADKFYFGEHMRYYYGRTAGVNSMLVFDPREFSYNGGGAIPGQDAERYYPEHGGQRLNRGSCNAFTFSEYLHRKMADPSDRKDGARQHWECGDVVAFEHAPDYSWSYVCGDATQAYNNPKRVYSKGGGRKNRPKIDLFTRSMVWLDGKYLAVFDRVNALEASYRKAWLLHSQARPAVSGKAIKAEVPGHIEDFDGDTVRITWGDGQHKPPDPSDPGRIFVKTFLPAEHYIRRIGGKGYEFWSSGANHPPPSGPREMDCGAWRVEVSPSKARKFDNFLHLLYVCDTRTEKMPLAAMVTAEGGEMVGVAAGRWLVMFGRKGRVKGAVSYKSPAGAARHLVVDLAKNAGYVVNAGGKTQKVKSSKEGTLRFSGSGKVTIRPE